MLGIKGVVLKSALKFLNKNNQKTLSWEFRLSNSNDSHTSQLQIISRYKVLSLFLKSFPSEDSRSWGYWYWRNFTLLSFSSMIWSYLYSTLSDIVYYTAVWATERYNIAPAVAEKKRGIQKKSCILRKNTYGCIQASKAASLTFSTL